MAVGFLKENGGDGGLSAEACSTGSPITYGDNGVCQGAHVSIAVQ